MYHKIAIVGSNGSGKTTLGRMLAQSLGYKHMDIEAYCFAPSEIPYANPRGREEETALLLADMQFYDKWIFTTASCDYGEPINGFYDLIIYLKAPLEVRLSRVKDRAEKQWGERILPGGDMYEQENAFFDYVASRNMKKTEAFLEMQSCPIVPIDSSREIETYYETIKDIITGRIVP